MQNCCSHACKRRCLNRLLVSDVASGTVPAIKSQHWKPWLGWIENGETKMGHQEANLFGIAVFLMLPFFCFFMGGILGSAVIKLTMSKSCSSEGLWAKLGYPRTVASLPTEVILELSWQTAPFAILHNVP